jgi:hypothetical protein
MSKMRDAIVMSGFTWKAFNIPERLALALAALGARVLYCENPVSFFKQKEKPPTELSPQVVGFAPRLLGHRVNRWSWAAEIQSRRIAERIAFHANELMLRDPIVFYPYMERLLPVCAHLKRKGYYLVHLSGDHPQPRLLEHVTMANQTMTVIRTSFFPLRAQFGDTIHFLPELAPSLRDQEHISSQTTEHSAFASIPRPRLTYLGSPQSRLHSGLLQEVLAARPNWHFVHFGQTDCRRSNAHSIPWTSTDELAQILAGTDVGFMPYDCRVERDFHCAPLKLFDYFAAGLPVVSTSIVYLWEMNDLVYLGDTPKELISAVDAALAEPVDSPKRPRRKAIAQEHSLENIAAELLRVLPLQC